MNLELSGVYSEPINSQTRPGLCHGQGRAGSIAYPGNAVISHNPEVTHSAKKMNRFLGLPKTLSKYEIPPNEIRNEYQTVGYRPPHQPWTNYLLSVFQANNQSINVWTQVIPFLVMIYRIVTLSATYDFIFDPHMRPLGTGLITFAIMFLVSSLAHCFCDKTELVHYMCFFVDFSAVGLFGMGTTFLSHRYYVHDDNLGYFLDKFSVPIGIILAVSICFVGCFTKIVLGKRDKLKSSVIMMVVVGVSYLWFQVPIIYSLIQGNGNVTQHLHHTSWMVAGALFYGSHWPERTFPGTFDILGNSHHFFHLCLYVSCELVIKTAVNEINRENRNFESRLPPSVIRTYGCLVIISFIDCLLLVAFYQIIKLKISHKKSQKSTTNNNESKKI